MSRHVGHKFSTPDQDNDVWTNRCAVTYKGAWWYEKCHSSNLNGAYLRGVTTSYADGVVWHHWRGLHYSLRFTEMKIRPFDYWRATEHYSHVLWSRMFFSFTHQNRDQIRSESTKVHLTDFGRNLYLSRHAVPPLTPILNCFSLYANYRCHSVITQQKPQISAKYDITHQEIAYVSMCCCVI